MAKKKSRLGNNPLAWIKNTTETAEMSGVKEEEITENTGITEIAELTGAVEPQLETGSSEIPVVELKGKSRIEILNMIKNNQITLEQGLKFIKQDSAGSGKSGSKAKDEPALIYFQSYWEKSTLEIKQVKNKQAEPFVFFDTDEKIYRSLQQRLPDYSKKAILVKPGKSYLEKKNQVYEINPREPDHYRRLARDLGQLSRVPVNFLHMWSKPGEPFFRDLRDQLDRGIYSLFYLSRALMEHKLERRVQLLYVYPVIKDEIPPQYAGVSGFARTIRQENPDFIYKTIETADVLEVGELLREYEPDARGEFEIGYFHKKRFVRRFKEIEPGKDTITQLPLKENGVYVITGGTGNLGMIAAEYLAGKVKARLVLTGRSPLNPEKKKKIKQLESSGSEVLYVQADTAKRPDVAQLISTVKSRFKNINGLIHSAGVIHDGFILKKNPGEIDSVLAPKVYGTVYLDEALTGENLDFFVMFSSLSAVMGNVGQGDYAYANRFMDYFARWRETLRTEQQRSGRTVSVNWPYWLKGGMFVTGEDLAIASGRTGIEGMPTREGINALEIALQCNRSQCIVAYGNREKIKQYFAQCPPIPSIALGPLANSDPAPPPRVDPEILFEKTGNFLKKILSEIIKLPANQIELGVRFEEYGIDSLIIKMFNTRVEKELCQIPKTLLFEYQTLYELTGYFVSHHRKELVHLFQLQAVPLPPRIPGQSPASPGTGHHDNIHLEEKPGSRRQVEDDIAIIGIGGRYSMARNPEEYWENLKNGRDCITEIPLGRWNYRDYFAPDPDKGKIYCKWGSFLEDIDKFDPLLFNISPREAKTIDPQERIFLETVWAALEDAGYTRKGLNKTNRKEENSDVGVFAGITTYLYHLLGTGGLQIRSLPQPWSLANRLSFVFDFHGPSMPVDTACSSSLTAIHLACESLKKGECRTAIAGGVNLYLHPAKYLGMCSMRMLSASGRCHTFGEAGDGFVPGEGVGAVLLKPLSAAVRDHDHIYAVIKGSAVNHGGRTNGFTVPNPRAQADLILQTLKNANINPRTISYLEAHGTGTSLGDPIEIQGLMSAYREYTRDKNYCSIGSAKSNIGHLESAAGIAGLTKVILQMKYKQLVPSLHCEKLNPNIDFENSPFYVQQELTEWQQPVIPDNGNRKKYPRRAGISSFGAGGTNVHLILEEYRGTSENKTSTPDTQNHRPQLIVLSAQNKERLETYSKNMVEFLEKNTSSSSSSLSSPLISPGDKQLTRKIRQDLLTFVSGILKVEETNIDILEDLNEYGFDAVHLSGLTDRINRTYNLNLGPGLLAGYSSVHSLAEYLYKEYADRIKPYYFDKNFSSPPLPSGIVDTGTPGLTDIAYTLQEGREHMDERIAMIVSSTAELTEKLRQYSRGDRDMDNFHTKNIKSERSDSRQLIDGEEGEDFIRKIVGSGKLNKLARLWVSGVEIDWQLLYPEQLPNRISLPTYPFAGKQYWITAPPQSNNSREKRFHPLIDRITPELSLGHGLVFHKTLEKDDAIVKDHRVANQYIMPGVGYLEMAHAALCQADGSGKFSIRSVVWLQPLVVRTEKEEISIVLNKNQDRDNEKLHFEVRTNNAHQTIVHARGEFCSNHREIPVRRNPQQVSIEEIKSRCSRRIDSRYLYNLYEQVGIIYGPYFRGVKQIYMNDEEALGFLHLPPRFEADFNYYTLHPTLMDGALQTITALWAESGNNINKTGNPLLPFSVENIEILQSLKERVYSYVRAANGQNEYNVAILDETGRLCVKFHNVTFRELKLKNDPVKTNNSKDQLEHFFYKPGWVASPLSKTDPGLTGNSTVKKAEKQTVLIFYPPRCRGLDSAIAKEHPGDEVIKIKLGYKSKLKPKGDREIDFRNPLTLDKCIGNLEQIHRIYFFGGIAVEELDIHHLESWEDCQERGLLTLFRLIKALGNHGFTQTPLCLKVITNSVHQVVPKEPIRPYAAGLYGLAGTAAKEYPGWDIACIDISLEGIGADASTQEMKTLISSILAEPGNKKGEVAAYRDGKRYTRKIEAVKLPPVPQSLFRSRGVYLILGGAGGIGLELGRRLAEIAQARLVLLDRNPLNPQQKEKIAQIESTGGEVLYIQADAANIESMKSAVNRAKSRFGQINGVIHSAIVLRDKSLELMDEENFQAALIPKVRGSVVLYNVIREEPLDFMMFFSSAQSFSCSAGQGNYAAACNFKDAFAHYLNSKNSYPVKIINWGFWGTVGVVASEYYNKRLAAQGLHSIEPQEGMEALQRLLGHRVTQVLGLKVEEDVLNKLGVDPQYYLEMYPENISAFETAVPEIQPLPVAADKTRKLEQVFGELTRFGRHLLLGAFQQMGVFKTEGKQYSREDLLSITGIIPGYTRLYQRLSGILAQSGFIRFQDSDQGIVTTNMCDTPDWHRFRENSEEEKNRLIEKFPDFTPHFLLLWNCIQAYPRILTGEIPGTQVMFPGSQTSLVEGIYKGNTIADYFNRLAAQSVGAYIQTRLPHLEPGEKITIIEVGAGTGGTSAHVLNELQNQGNRLRYIYTDISPAFTRHGKAHYGQSFPFVEFNLLNIEEDVEEQGFEPGKADVVIAANVLHATRDIGETLCNIKILLKTHGWLILNELTCVPEFVTLTFGLLDGWWLYEDAENRLEGSPLLDSVLWQKMLESGGFERVKCFGLETKKETGEEKENSTTPHHHIFIAESNGEVRKKKREKIAKTKTHPGFEPNDLPPKKVKEVKKAVKDEVIDRRQLVEQYISAALAEVLQVDSREFDTEASYSDFGVDSILAVEIINILNDKLMIRLKSTDLFTYPSIRVLTDHITAEFGSKIEYSQPADECIENAGKDIVPGLFHTPEHGPPGPAEPGKLPADSGDILESLLERMKRGELDIYETHRLLEVL